MYFIRTYSQYENQRYANEMIRCFPLNERRRCRKPFLTLQLTPYQSGVCWFLYPINQYYIHSITDGVLQMLVNLILWCIDLASIFQMISKRMMVISTWNLQQCWKFP